MTLLLLLVATALHAGSITPRFMGPDGSVLPRYGTLYVCDLNYNPVGAIYGQEPGKPILNLPEGPLLFTILLDVPKFGILWFTGDNGGQGYMPDGRTIDVAYEIARSRYLDVKSFMDSAKAQRYKFSAEVVKQMAAAEALLKQAESAAPGGAEQASFALKSIEESGPAGEKIVLEHGRQKLDRQGGLRKNVMISTFGFYEAREGKKWMDAMGPVFNGACAYWHWHHNMQADGSFNWSWDGKSPDDSVDRLAKNGKTIRGHCMVWLGSSIPPWFPKPYTFDGIRKNTLAFTTAIVKHYPQVKIWNIANEANNSWDVYKGTLDLEPEQVISLIGEVSKITATQNPKAIRGINTTDLWGGDASHNLGPKPRILGPYQFLEMCKTMGVGYEYIGMQTYFDSHDMFEVHMMLERYKRLGKRIRICEMDTCSENRPKPGNTFFPQGFQMMYQWHRPWDPQLQADWLEDMFIVTMSKDYVDEWNWWDLADYAGCYLPWGGIMDENYAPKPSYTRLEQLIKRWGKKLKGISTNSK